MKCAASLPLSISVAAFCIVTACHAQEPAWWSSADTGPTLAQALGPGADASWEVSGGSAPKDGGPFRIENDPLLARPALICGARPMVLRSRTVFDECEISAQVRLKTTAERKTAYFGMTVALDPADAASKGLPLRIMGQYDGNLYVTPVGPRVTYVPRAYPKIMPTWNDAIRIPIEKDMGSVPASQDKWMRVRWQLTAGRARCWVDDRLVLDRHDPELKTSGVVKIDLQAEVCIADLSVVPLVPVATAYEPIALDGYVGDRSLLDGAAIADGSLPFGRQVTVDGIPLRFSAKTSATSPDHIDVGRSLLRQGNMEGYFPSRTERFIGAMTVDPARIQLRIPNARYDAMYVVAGFDDEKDNVPLLTASFFRPGAGFPMVFEATVPSIRSKASYRAQALPVRLENGRQVNLWLVKIPLDPSKLTSFADMDVLEVELSKEVRQYRSYPDPYIYGWHGAGLPSGVHVYAVTLHRSDLEMALEPAQFGHVWTDPQQPSYAVTVSNRGDASRAVSLAALTRSDDGEEHLEQEKNVTVPAGKTVSQIFTFAVTRNGIHELTMAMRDGDTEWVETRNFARLHADTRAPVWKPGEGPFFGYWSYHGGHHTPPATNIMTVMKAAGARGPVRSAVPEIQALADKWQWPAGANAWPVSPQWAWAGEDELDPEKVKAYKTEVIEKLRKAQGDNPEFVTFFPEPHVSRDLTAGNPPEYWGDPSPEMTEHEQKSFKVFWNTSKVAAEAVREAWPKTKILIPWGDPLFIVPFLRAGFPKDLIDGSGLDMIGFERLPEQQLHQQSTHRLYVLKEEYRKYGMEDPLLYYIEGVFVPTEPGACTWQEQAERYHRWTLISLAYGVKRFNSGWFAYDCGNYYGAEHYGGCGIQRRIPYSDPKPGYAHYATMTRMLDRATFDRWLPTGSHTAYCLKFTRPQGGPVYALWTVRGKRPVVLSLPGDGAVTVTDSMDNDKTFAVEEGRVEFELGTSPIYVTGAGDIDNVTLGESDHADAMQWARSRNQQTWYSGPVVRRPPVGAERTLAHLGDGSWSIVDERDEAYEDNNYDTKRFHGKMTAAVVEDEGRDGPSLAVHLEQQDMERQLMPWYCVLKPRKPVPIPGKASALGLWVKAGSDWGRVVYSLRDARGERWISVGTKDQWNCNDVHGWSMFNFDGWRYLRFELPSHSEYDSFREYGTTWWGRSGGDGIVDLPLKLETILVERRTHVLYVNDIQPANPADVLLGELVAEYETEFDATDEALALNRIRMPLPEGDFGLPNPIEDMAQADAPEPVTLEKVTMPDWGYDGTRAHVHFSPAADAAEYQVWVSAYPDGRGAAVLGKMKESGGLVNGFRPAMKLYLWVTYDETPAEGAAARRSVPSNRLAIDLVDAFGQK